MAKAVYRVVKKAEDWGVEHDDDVSGSYVTKEAAFEAAVAAATLSLGEGHSVEIQVPEGAEGRWA